MATNKQFTAEVARQIGDTLGIDWDTVDLEQFRIGLGVEMEHGSNDPRTDVTHDDPILTGKIAWAHINEFADYYVRLAQLEKEADAYWAKQRQPV
ncbi:MAG: DUF5661 family protein [Chloroflexota bacterium]